MVILDGELVDLGGSENYYRRLNTTSREWRL